MPRTVRARAPVYLALVIAIGLAGVTLTTPAQANHPGPDPLHVVLLGDSYSAGNAATDTYFGPSGCYRSQENWAQRYVDQLAAAGYDPILTNRACNGAHIDNVMSEQVLFNTFENVESVVGDQRGLSDPEWQQLLGPPYCPPVVDDDTWTFSASNAAYDPISDRTSVLAKCLHKVPAQIEAVGQQTDLVLMTIGGNDGQFDQLLGNCFGGPAGVFFPDDCAQNLVDAETYLNALGVDGFRQELQQALLDIEYRLPDHAKLVLLSYPYLDLGGNTRGDEVRDLGDLTDTRAAEAVATVNANVGREFVVFVDTVKAAFAGHEPDGSVLMNPDRWFFEFWPDTTDFREMYHPNPLGHQGYADVLAPFGIFLPGPIESGDVDVVFVLDATSSMDADLEALKAHAAELVGEIESATKSSRFGLVTYRDDPSHTGVSSDYSSRIDYQLSYDSGGFVSALQAVDALGGGDEPDTVLSGLATAASLEWRPGVRRIIVQFGDSAPHDPEPISGLTSADVVSGIMDAGGIGIYSLSVASAGGHPATLVDLVETTSGGLESATDPVQVPDKVSWLVDEALRAPYARAGGPYVTAHDEQVVLDALGSYSPSGSIVSYEWDLDGDLVYDVSETGRTHVTSFPTDYDGRVVLRVTDSQGLASIAATSLSVSDDGDGIPAEFDNCPTLANPGQSDFDGDGLGDRCDLDPGFSRVPQNRPCGVACFRASSFGDPHMVTFDGLSYDLQTVGEHVVVESADGSIVIQVRHQPGGISETVSVNTAVAASVAGSEVGFYLGGQVIIDGEPATIADGGMIGLFDGSSISRGGNTYSVMWATEGGDQPTLNVKMSSDHLNLSVLVPPDLSGQLSGLLGNADSDPSNDIAARGGSVLSQPVSSSVLYGTYADSWRITQEESLFNYGPGESTGTFTDLSFPSSVVTAADLDPEQVASAESTCFANGVTDPVLLDACALDLVLTGSSSMIAGAAEAPHPVIALEGTYSATFEDADAAGWSAPTIVESEAGGEHFLGLLSSSSNRLTLNDVPPHTKVTLSFDLYVLGGWDGDSGPDRFAVSVVGGATLADHSFSNTTAQQDYPVAGSAAQSGAVAVDTLGSYGGDGSAVYHLEYTFDHWLDTLQVDFTGVGPSAIDGEFWGLDNVEVRMDRIVYTSAPDAGPVTVNISLAGQEGQVSFPGTAGQRVSMTEVPTGMNTYVRVFNPSGSVLTQGWTWWFDVVTLPESGLYTIEIDPENNGTGSSTISLYEVPPDETGLTITPSGDPVTVDVLAPGHNPTLTFQGTSGQRISMMELPTSGLKTEVFIYKPSGPKLVSGWGWWFDTMTLPETGTYTIKINGENDDTGSTTLTMYEVPADETGLTATIGGDPVTITTSVPGQNATLTFEGTAGQRVSMIESATTAGFDTLVGVYRPSGAKVVEGWGWWFDTFVLPETGTYTLKVNGQNEDTGSTTLTLYEVPADETGLTATIGGDPVTITTTVPGQNATLTFEGTAGQSVRLDVVDVSMNALVGIYTQSGTKLAEGWGSPIGPISLPATASYVIKVNPSNDTTGSTQLTLVDTGG